MNIPFVSKFAVNPQKGEQIAEDLKEPFQLSGLLNFIIHRLPYIADDGFTITPSIAGIIDDWCPVPEESKKWIEANVEAYPNWVIPTTQFYEYFCNNSPADGLRERRRTIAYMKTLFPGVEANISCRVQGKTVKCYRGVRMKDLLVHERLETLGALRDLELEIAS